MIWDFTNSLLVNSLLVHSTFVRFVYYLFPVLIFLNYICSPYLGLSHPFGFCFLICYSHLFMPFLQNSGTYTALKSSQLSFHNIYNCAKGLPHQWLCKVRALWILSHSSQISVLISRGEIQKIAKYLSSFARNKYIHSLLAKCYLLNNNLSKGSFLQLES